MSTVADIDALLEKARLDHVFSAYQLHLEQSPEVWSFAKGTTSYWPDGKAVQLDTLFDLGSLTKVIATTSLLATQIEKGRWTLETTAAEIQPRFAESKYADLTLASLLAHCSGLVGWAPLYATWPDQQGDLVDWLLHHSKTLIARSPNQAAEYSDVGFWVLSALIDPALNGVWEQQLRDTVWTPLGLEGLVYGPVDAPVAATEYCRRRGRLIQGEVFDDNTDALGGIAGHAGLFGSAAQLAPFCREWLRARKGRSKWLSQETALRFTERSNLVSDSAWAYGWDTRSETGSTAGTQFSNKSFGALGFPGTSIWIDPEVDAFAIFLTNRVHPSREDNRIRSVRPKLHDHIAQLFRGKK